MKLIKFYTTWCQPCKILSTMLKEIKLTGIELLEIDAEADAALAKQYGVQSVPVLIIEKDGQEVDRINGIVPLEEIEERIKRL